MARCTTQRERRRGGIGLAALIALPVVLLAFVVGLSSRQYRDIHTRMQAEADASALAGVHILAGDELLRGRLQSGMNNYALYTLLQSGRLEVLKYAEQNPVFLNFSVPEWNTTTPTSGDIQYGSYDRTLATPFSPVPILDGMGVPSTNLHTINALKVYMRRSHDLNNAVPIPRMPIVGKGTVDASTVATAMLDGDLQGFRPLFADRPMRLVPVALDYATVAAATADDYAFNGNTNTFSMGGDNLPEIEVNLTTATMVVPTTAVSLNVGYTTAPNIAQQIVNGTYAAQLTGAPFNGAFILQDAGGLPAKLKMAVPGQEFFSVGDGGTLEAALGTLAMSPYTPRIFPLYEGVDGMGQPIIISFIAARVIAVATTTDGMGDIDSIKLTLQPTLVSDPNAVTNTAFRGHVGVPNLTIAKLRLVP